jgi:sec-independent protein translocase protein TatC
MTEKARTPANPGPDAEQPLIAHLLELRDRLIRALIGIAVAFVPFAIFAGEIYTFMAAPLMKLLPPGATMIATEVAAPFFAPFKLAAILALFAALPWVLYQVWAFVAPGLYQSERRLVVPLLATSTALFYLGVAFAYFIVFPLVFGFFVGITPEGVTVMTDISRYLDFIFTMFIAFGLVFETPVAIVLMVKTGFLTPAQLASKREYVFLGAFVFASFITPPDVLSQILLALPGYLLFELGIVCARWWVPGHREVEAQQKENSRTT